MEKEEKSPFLTFAVEQPTEENTDFEIKISDIEVGEEWDSLPSWGRYGRIWAEVSDPRQALSLPAKAIPPRQHPLFGEGSKAEFTLTGIVFKRITLEDKNGDPKECVMTTLGIREGRPIRIVSDVAFSHLVAAYALLDKLMGERMVLAAGDTSGGNRIWSIYPADTQAAE